MPANGPTGTSWSSRKGNAKSTSGEEETHAPVHIVHPQSGTQLCRKGAEVPVGQRSPVVSRDKLGRASSGAARKWSFFSAQHLWDQNWSAVFGARLPSTKQTLTYLSKHSKGLLRWLRAWSICQSGRHWKSCDYLGWKRRGLGGKGLSCSSWLFSEQEDWTQWWSPEVPKPTLRFCENWMIKLRSDRVKVQGFSSELCTVDSQLVYLRHQSTK